MCCAAPARCGSSPRRRSATRLWPAFSTPPGSRPAAPTPRPGMWCRCATRPYGSGCASSTSPAGATTWRWERPGCGPGPRPTTATPRRPPWRRCLRKSPSPPLRGLPPTSTGRRCYWSCSLIWPRWPPSTATPNGIRSPAAPRSIPSSGVFCWAARAEGLGGVLTTMLIRQEEQVKQLLGAPPTWALAAVLALGHPVTQPRRLRRRPVPDFATVDRVDGPPLGRPGRPNTSPPPVSVT